MKLFQTKTEQQVIEEIHNEFDTAQDRLLSQAESFLTEMNLETESKMEQKADKLKALGFVNAAPVKWVQENSLIKSKQQAELIRYYKQEYPFQKFLTESELERICKKYNLIFAPVENYVKDVPEKNIDEISKSKSLYGKDSQVDKIIYRCRCAKNVSSKERKMLAAGIEMSVSDFRDSSNNHNCSIVLGRKIDCIYQTLQWDADQVSKRGLFIAAPQSHFDLKGLKKTGIYSFMSFTKIEPKDPIVFRYCRGGIQVLSKWGLEAEDSALVNEKLN